MRQDDSEHISALTGKLFKVIVLGDGFVGKTAITVRFCEDKFQKEYKMTIGVNFGVKKFKYKDNVYALQIWDIAGQERFKFLRTRYYIGAVGVILVYDVTNKLTFQNLNNWGSEFQKQIGTKPAIVVGNKVDLPSTGYIDPRTKKQYEKEVSFEEGEELAQSLNAPFFETSAKQGSHINDMFMTLVNVIEEKKESQKIDLTSFKSIDYGFAQLQDLINQGFSNKIFDGLLKLKTTIFRENPYSVVLGNINQWLTYIQKVQFNRVVREKFVESFQAWKIHYPHSLEEGQAVTSRL